MSLLCSYVVVSMVMLTLSYGGYVEIYYMSVDEYY